MRAVGRNDPCPCGSGRKHKRCCLDGERTALRLADQLERRIDELGDQVRQEHRTAWRAEFERSIGPLPPLGGVVAEEAEWLDSWLVCHASVVDGRTPLEACEQADNTDAQLATSSICGLWVRGTGRPVAATHWRFEEPLMLHARHEPFGTLREGALLVARGVEIGLGHVALVGRPVVVDEGAVDDVLALLHRAPDQALCAALRWPEERTYTAEGELVQQRFRRYDLRDPDAAVALLRDTPGMSEKADVLTYWEDDVEFSVAGAPIHDITQPPPEPGVVWTLCEEDITDPPLLGEVTVSREDRELALNAPTERRLERLVPALPGDLRASLGDVTHQQPDLPDILPRLRRDRMDDLVGEARLPTG
jgi:hypothetical protein